ncbi:MAG: acyl-CoA dehydrogenase family protein [Nitrospirota bacterium]
MEFTLTEEQIMLQSNIRKLARELIIPDARERDEKCQFPFEIIKHLAKLGLMGIIIPDKYGGAGMDYISYVLIIEELARADASTCISVAAHNSLCTNHIYISGTEEQKKRYVVPLAKGEKLGAWALTESGAGSDAGGIQTTARFRDGKWILRGNKIFITHGSVADIYVINAKTDISKGSKGISAFIVEKGNSNFSAGRIEDKIGLRGSDTAELILDDVAVPEENLLGRLNEGFSDILKVLEGGRIGIGALSVGIGRAGLEESIKYSRERKQFGQSISNFQAIQWMLSDMATELDAARLLVYRAAYLKNKGLPCTKESSMAKLYASETAMRATTKAIQIHGGHGCIKEYPVERYFRDAKICEVGEGTSEIQRLIIAREIIKGDAIKSLETPCSVLAE